MGIASRHPSYISTIAIGKKAKADASLPFSMTQQQTPSRLQSVFLALFASWRENPFLVPVRLAHQVASLLSKIAAHSVAGR